MFPYVPTIHPGRLHRALRRGKAGHLVDIRCPEEFALGHVTLAVSLPRSQLSMAAIRDRFGPAAGRQEPLYLLSDSGTRAEQAALRLRNLGLDNVAVVDGGVDAWRASGLPLQGKSTIWPIEQQVQIALGVVLLLVLAKGMLLHPLFYLLIGLLGVGLIAGGLRSGSLLNALLARMPWNKALSTARATTR